MVHRTTSGASFVVTNDRRWTLNPKFGTLHVYVDGRPRRVVRLNQQGVIRVSPGVHSIRVRHWWFMSPPRTVDARPRSEIHLHADVASEPTMLRRMAGAVFRPLRSLSLTADVE